MSKRNADNVTIPVGLSVRGLTPEQRRRLVAEASRELPLAAAAIARRIIAEEALRR